VAHLSGCKKHHFGAFIKDQQLLVVWDDDPRSVLGRAENIVNSLVQMIWEQTESAIGSDKPGEDHHNADTHRRHVTASELESGVTSDKRPTLLINSIMVALTIALLITALGFGWRNLAQEVSIDNNYTRLALLAVSPCQIFVSLFFMQTIVVNIGQILGPINQLHINSKFYSGKPPPRLDRNLKTLPHVTIQMPVYKEGLRSVIRPTIRSLRAALSTYELQGGTCNIFVNDDGMQLLPEQEAQARRDFYDEHNIGWVARPKHNPKPQGDEKLFIRGGKFKKASNMNFALMISNKVEEELLKIERGEDWDQEKERAAYELCLAKVLEDDPRAWAAGDIRVGDYILLIDSDTRVPTDCLLDATSEMELSPQVAILQYSSGVMTVTDSFFEKGSVYIASPPVFLLTVATGLRSSLISSTLLFDIQLPMAMWPRLWVIMLFSVGRPYSTLPMWMTVVSTNSGPSRMSLKTLICLSVFRLQATPFDLDHTPEMVSRKGSPSPFTMN
jgi:hypothetical protein